MSRNRDALKKYLSNTEPIMEIGPLIRPFLSAKEYNVYYADIHDKEEIFQKYLRNGVGYQAHGVQSADELFAQLVPIDFVIKDTYKKAVGEILFSSIFSSHVIEHTTDIIKHLIDLYECLSDNGYLVMAIPDKRYTFDRFREVTPFRDALDVYVNGEKSTARMVFDFVFSAHFNNYSKDYHANDVSFLPVAIDQRYDNAYKEYCAVKAGLWLNAHFWVFTYSSFIAFLRDGIRSGFFSYSLEYAAPPAIDSNEFHVVLKKNKLMQSDEKLRLSEILKLQFILDDIDGVGYYSKLTAFCTKHDSIYIYGAGVIGKAVYALITSLGKEINVCGFIVSDNQLKLNALLNKPVYYFSEVPYTDGCGILVSIVSNQEVILKLDEAEWNYFKVL